MKLYLLQHGEACAKSVDPERPLTEQGQEDINRLADFFKQAGIGLDRLLHSGKLRARQTAESLAAAIGAGKKPEICQAIQPNDPPEGFNWQSECQGGDTLVVGHLPFLEKLVTYLLVGHLVDHGYPGITAYKPGSVVCLELGDDGAWRINWMLRPELLSQLEGI